MVPSLGWEWEGFELKESELREAEDSDVRAAAEGGEDAMHACTWVQQCNG